MNPKKQLKGRLKEVTEILLDEWHPVTPGSLTVKNGLASWTSTKTTPVEFSPGGYHAYIQKPFEMWAPYSAIRGLRIPTEEN